MNCCAWSSILSFSSSIADIRRPNSFKELKNIRYWLSDAFPYYFIEYDTINIFTRVNQNYSAYPAIIISSSVCWFPMHSNLKLRRVFDNLRWAEDNAVKINRIFKSCWHNFIHRKVCTEMQFILSKKNFLVRKNVTFIKCIGIAINIHNIDIVLLRWFWLKISFNEWLKNRKII